MHLQCAEGYEGRACSECRRNGTKPFGRSGTLNCNPCRPAGVINLAYIASTLLVLLLLCYVIHTTLEENLEDTAEAAGQPVKASQLLKVVMPLVKPNLARQQLLVHASSYVGLKRLGCVTITMSSAARQSFRWAPAVLQMQQIFVCAQSSLLAKSWFRWLKYLGMCCVDSLDQVSGMSTVGPVSITEPHFSALPKFHAAIRSVAGIHSMVAVHNAAWPSQHSRAPHRALALHHCQLCLLFYNQWQPFNRLPSESGINECCLQEAPTALDSASHQPAAPNRHPNIAVSYLCCARILIMPVIPSATCSRSFHLARFVLFHISEANMQFVCFHFDALQVHFVAAMLDPHERASG